MTIVGPFYPLPLAYTLIHKNYNKNFKKKKVIWHCDGDC